MKIRIKNSKTKQYRLTELNFGSKILLTPTYFPAISSVEKFLDIQSLVKLITSSSYPQMLISAFDFHYDFQKNKKIIKDLKKYSKEHFLFVDSGGYEKFWIKQKWEQKNYDSVIEKIDSDFYTSFDNDKKFVESEYFDNIINDGSLQQSSQFIPIFHQETSIKLLKTIKNFLDKYPFTINFLAVKEKELGSSIIERAKTVYQIRKIINQIGGDHILHVLGVGHPTSLALYSYCGADSFDSTDWYNYSLDIQTSNLRDVSHLPLIKNPSPSIEKIKQPMAKTFVHNLDSYNALMKKIQNLIKINKLENYLKQIQITKKHLDYIKA